MTALHCATTIGTLDAALDWLLQARDSSNAAFPPPCPLIPTLYLAAWHLERPELARRAERAAQSAVERQLASGAVWGGVVETGQALRGWLSAFAETGSGVFAGAARRAGRFLFATLDDDGVWRRDGAHSPHTAWALAETGRRLGAPELRAAAAKHLRAVARLQHDDGWMPDPRFPERARGLASIADAIRGLLEGGRLLRDERLIALAARAAAGLAAAHTREGRLPDRFVAGWQPVASASSPAGQAHMVNVWLRLFEITGARAWLEPVRPVLRALTSAPPTKFLVDALIRDERIARGLAGVEGTTAALVLA